MSVFAVQLRHIMKLSFFYRLRPFSSENENLFVFFFLNKYTSKTLEMLIIGVLFNFNFLNTENSC